MSGEDLHRVYAAEMKLKNIWIPPWDSLSIAEQDAWKKAADRCTAAVRARMPSDHN